MNGVSVMTMVDLFAGVGGLNTGLLALVVVALGWWVRDRRHAREHERAMRRLDLIERAAFTGPAPAAKRLRELLPPDP